MILSILMSWVKRMKIFTGNFNNSNAIITPSDHPNNKSIKNSQMKWYFFLPFLHYINGEKLRSNVQFELCFVFLTDQLNSSKNEGVQIVGAVKFNTVQKNESNRDKRDWIKTMCVCVGFRHSVCHFVNIRNYGNSIKNRLSWQGFNLNPKQFE